MKKLLDGIALLVLYLGCVFEFIIAFLFSRTTGEIIKLNITLIYIHVGLMILSAGWLFTRVMNNWERE